MIDNSFYFFFRLVLRVFQTSFYPSVLQRIRSHLLTSDEGQDMKAFGDLPTNINDTDSKTSTAT